MAKISDKHYLIYLLNSIDSHIVMYKKECITIKGITIKIKKKEVARNLKTYLKNISSNILNYAKINEDIKILNKTNVLKAIESESSCDDLMKLIKKIKMEIENK